MPDHRASTDSASSGINAVPTRPGPWRAVSILVVFAALVVVALSVLQARAASDIAAPQRRELPLDQVTVTADGLDVPEGSEIAVLGLPDAESRRLFDAAGTALDIPREAGALVSVTNPDGDIIAMAVTPPDMSSSDVQISARSTARSLLGLSPGMLRPNLAETFANQTVIEADPAFQTLVDAVEANSNISVANDQVEQAFAAIADRLPILTAPPDQGCDSVVSRDAYVSAGTCVQPGPSGLTISNEQDRWALVFHDTADGPTACGVLAPSGGIGDEELISFDTCQGVARLAAPGPDADYRDDQAMVDRYISIATGVTTLYEYVGPFANLAAGSAGFASESTSHIRRNFAPISQSIERLLDSSDEFAFAMTGPMTETTAAERHVAAVRAAELLISESELGSVLPQRLASDTGHEAILDFYVRAGERMTSSRTDWRWIANASDTLDFGATE